MASVKTWIAAARLRTLPLAVAVVLLGSSLAAFRGSFSWGVFGLTLLTALLLQMLSNLANDYGDSQHGADSADRLGPKRQVQAGLISAVAMRRAMALLAGLSLLSGVLLLWVALSANPTALFTLLGAGVAAIVAAIAYTNGKRPYGYAGFGDLFVLIFFGWVGVLGTAYLQTESVVWVDLLPATALGLLATGVLNLNNIRDMDSDVLAGKNSIPVRLGRQGATLYHLVLLVGAFVAQVAFNVSVGLSAWGYLFVAILPLLWRNGLAVATLKEPQQLDPFLRQLAISTLFFVVLIGIGLYLNA